MAALSSRSSGTPGLWTGTSCQTKLSPGRIHSLSRSAGHLLKYCALHSSTCLRVVALFCEKKKTILVSFSFFCKRTFRFVHWVALPAHKLHSMRVYKIHVVYFLRHQGALSAIYSALRRCAPAPVLEPVQSSSLAQRRGMKKQGSPKGHSELQENE